MKRIISIFMIIGFMFIFSGCPDKEETNEGDNKVNVMKVDVKSARVLMENYMRYLMKRNSDAMRSFYGANTRMKIKETPAVKDPHPIGYSLNEGESKNKTAVFKAHIFSGSSNLPYFSDDEFTYTVVLEGGKMVIDNIEKGKTVELYENGASIYKREGDKVKGDILVALKDLPNYVISKESSLIEQKFILPKQAFGPCALSPDGKTAIITSYDNNSFIGAIEEGSKETMAQQGGKSQGQGGGKGGQSGGSQQGGGQEEKGGETKSNMKLKTIDFYFDCMVNSINFSPDGDMFVVEYTPKKGMHQIAVYKGSTGEQVRLESNKQFNRNRFEMTRPYFSSPDELVFTLIPAKNSTPEEARFKGDWKLNIKKGEIKQIE